MKSYFFFFLILILSFSCKKEYEKANDSFAGIWKLDKMEYQNSTGTLNVVNDNNISLIFTYDNKIGSSSGFEVIGSDTIKFEYSVDYEFGDIYIMLKNQSDMVKLPINGIGRIQVYQSKKISKKTIEISAEYEYDQVLNQNLTNTSYLFTKVSEY